MLGEIKLSCLNNSDMLIDDQRRSRRVSTCRTGENVLDRRRKRIDRSELELSSVNCNGGVGF